MEPKPRQQYNPLSSEMWLGTPTCFRRRRGRPSADSPSWGTTTSHRETGAGATCSIKAILRTARWPPFMWPYEGRRRVGSRKSSGLFYPILLTECCSENTPFDPLRGQSKSSLPHAPFLNMMYINMNPNIRPENMAYIYQSILFFLLKWDPQTWPYRHLQRRQMRAGGPSESLEVAGLLVLREEEGERPCGQQRPPQRPVRRPGA